MINDFEDLIGHGTDLTIIQMSIRAVLMFVITLGIIRISGQRSFASKSTFDNIITIMLGAVLSRAVIGASPFVPTIFAGLCFGILHRVLAYASMHNHALSSIIKGNKLVLFENGAVNHTNLKKATLSSDDLIEALRLHANIDSLDQVESIRMERNGELSVVKKQT